jgi:hypothetical protein
MEWKQGQLNVWVGKTLCLRQSLERATFSEHGCPGARCRKIRYPEDDLWPNERVQIHPLGLGQDRAVRVPDAPRFIAADQNLVKIAPMRVPKALRKAPGTAKGAQLVGQARPSNKRPSDELDAQREVGIAADGAERAHAATSHASEMRIIACLGTSVATPSISTTKS